MTQLWSVTCHMGSHSVTCHLTQVNTPRLNPSHTGQYSNTANTAVLQVMTVYNGH